MNIVVALAVPVFAILALLAYWVGREDGYSDGFRDGMWDDGA